MRYELAFEPAAAEQFDGSLRTPFVGTPIEDRTAFSPTEKRKKVRPVENIYALVLHQTGFSRGNNPAKYDKVTAHYMILPNGKITQLHPVTAYLWASNGFNRGSVSVEFVGNFPSTRGKCYKPNKFGCHQLSPAQIQAGRDLVKHLIKEIGLTHILAHRQSSGLRSNDPGPDIWRQVGQWAVENLGLKDGGEGFKIGSGRPIPPEWRAWEKTNLIEESEFIEPELFEFEAEFENEGIGYVHGEFEEGFEDEGIGSEFAGGIPRFETGASPAVAAPKLIGQEASPPGRTIYVNIPLGAEQPAKPMTGVFIPESFVPRPQVNLVLYLHGHKTTSVCGPGDSISIDGYWRSRYWPLREEINKCRKNVILVAPTLGPKSQAGSLTKPGGFDAYLNQVMAALIKHGPYRNVAHSPTLGSIILACHSGGGSPMLKIVSNRDRYASRIQECWGFDCLYSGYADQARTKKLFTQPRKWIEWAESHKTQKLFIYYQRSTAIESDHLAKKAKEKKLRNVCVELSRARNHCWVPITHWRERIKAAGFLRDI